MTVPEDVDAVANEVEHVEHLQLCEVPPGPKGERPVPDDGDGNRLRLIRFQEKKWVNGSTIRYHFMRDANMRGTDDEMDMVRRGFQKWKDLRIGLNFLEVQDRSKSHVRIGFVKGNGAWSYLGRDVLDIPKNKRTMNLGFRRLDMDTILHEIGHTLALPHEHQNPHAGIVWDEEAVYKSLAAPPNRWDRQKTWWNIIRKIDARQVDGGRWDPNSIMHYPFGPGLIRKPERYSRGLYPQDGLSDQDIKWIRTFYPPLHDDLNPTLEHKKVHWVDIEAGEQVNFIIKPSGEWRYTFQTIGESDSVMVLFRKTGDDKFEKVAADDDSGQERNARFNVNLESGHDYILRVRLYYSHHSGRVGVVYW